VRTLFLILTALLLTTLPAPAQTPPTVRLAWDPNTEASLAGYELFWGTASGVYTSSKLIPKEAVTTEVTGLTPGVRYYFSIKAYDTEGLRSGFSNVVQVIAPDTGTVTFITTPVIQEAKPVP
jgi:hypothetical protein